MEIKRNCGIVVKDQKYLTQDLRWESLSNKEKLPGLFDDVEQAKKILNHLVEDFTALDYIQATVSIQLHEEVKKLRRIKTIHTMEEFEKLDVKSKIEVWNEYCLDSDDEQFYNIQDRKGLEDLLNCFNTTKELANALLDVDLSKGYGRINWWAIAGKGIATSDYLYDFLDRDKLKNYLETNKDGIRYFEARR